MRKFFRELKRRDVFRMAVFYVVGAWIVIQVTSLVFPGWSIPESSIRYVWIAAFLGLPIALIFSWRFDITARGIQRTPLAHEETTGIPLKNADRILIIALGVAAVAMVGVLTQLVIETQQSGPDESAQNHRDAPAKSVAVLAFTDLSPEGGQEWFSDGLTEEVLNFLARLPELKVTARTSAFHFKDQNLPVPEIGAALGVRYVVEGSVRRSGEDLRVTYQLIRAEDGFQIYSDAIDRSTKEVFDVQEEIAERVAAALNVVLDDVKREAMFALGTRNVDAYENYLRGQQLFYEWSADGTDEKIWLANDWLDKAIAADPEFATAYSLRSHAYIYYLDGVLASPAPLAESSDSISADWALEQLMSNISNAIAYAQNPELRLFNQINKVIFSDDFSDLPRLVDQVDPKKIATISDTLDIFRVQTALILLDKKDKALSVGHQRIDRNPLSPLAYSQAWIAAFSLGNLPLAVNILERGRSTAGTAVFNEVNMTITLFAANKFDEVIEMVKSPDWGFETFRESYLMLFYAIAGRTEEARSIYENISDSNQEQGILALALLEMGEIEAAQRMFGAIDARPGGIYHLLLVTISEYGGRVPFDLDWTPNFAARLAEAGVTLETFEFPRPVGVDGAKLIGDWPQADRGPSPKADIPTAGIRESGH